MNTMLLETYEILSELGRGGMGVVYLAQDHRLGRKVAIKELAMSGLVQPDEKENIIARFQREAQAASKLQHPNIVSVFDYFQEGERHFMVMELLEGKALQHYIDVRQPFSIEQLVDIGAQVCGALDYAHAHGIVHRDIKPDNVILLDNGRIKLMDFGVARHTGEMSKLTQTGTTLGTIAYISPEQLCDSRLVDGRSDLFSLGAMLYEMLTLRTPFDAGNVGGTIMKIMAEDPIPPRQMNPAIPARLEAVIMRSLRKNPDERFARAAEMGQALVNAIRAEAPPQQRRVNLNVMTCRGCGHAIPGGRGPCPKCGRLQAPPAGVPAAGPGAPPVPGRPNTAPLGAGPGGARPGTGPLGGPAYAQPRPGGGPGPGTGPLRGGRPILGAKFLFSFGSPGFKPGEFAQPRGLAIDSSRQVYVADTENGRVQVFDANGRFVREIRPANGRDSFRFPRSVSISPANGRVYVVDEMDFRIYVFDADGKQLQVWDRRRNQSEAAAVPGRMAITPNGVIYVSEPNNHRVMMYTSNHVFTSALGAGGELQSPSGLAIGPKGMLYVLDYGHCRVQTYDNRNKPVSSFGRRGMGPGEFSVPRDLAVDRGGAVVVADTLNHRVQLFDPQGQPIRAFGQKGKGEGEFAGPEGVVLSPDDWLYVSDRGNARVQVFQLDRG
jgi:DNA-binding beta-propeller fold protein YncE/tRNA A-37 threonylcarbamoyl transferase component Bud32